MRSLFLAIACLPLAACAGMSDMPNMPMTPAAMSQRTVVDEQAINGVELGYKTFRLAAETAVDAGWVKGADAKKLADVDTKLYAAVHGAEIAYEYANANDFASALKVANKALEEASLLIPKKK